MKIQVVLISLFTGLFSIGASLPEMVDIDQLQKKVITQNSDTLYVVNFWATWCAPCVKELPYFQSSASKYSKANVKVIFVSLDSPKDQNKVAKFIENKKVEQKVYLLNSGNPNVWIDKVDPSWGGAIPATVFYKTGKKIFFKEGEMSPIELDSLIQLKK